MARVLPPAGTPFTFGDIVSAVSCLFRSRTVSQFEREIKAVTGSAQVFAFNAGRTALTLALKALKTDQIKNEVIIPGYTCFTVPSAVRRAGLRARAIDFASGTMQYDIELLKKTDTSRTLAIILIYPFAMYSDPRPILEWAKSRGIFVIEDVAQGFGLRHEEKHLGTLGDIGIYSFSKGKTITSVRGGVAVTDNENIAKRLNVLRESECSSPGVMVSFRVILEAIILWLFLSPNRFGLVTTLPFVKLGETHYQPDFTLAKMSTPAAAIAIRKTRLLDQINHARREIGRTLRDLIAGQSGKNGVRVARESDSEHSLFLRVVVIAQDQRERDRLLTEGNALGMSRMYGEPLTTIDDPDLWAIDGKSHTPVCEDFAHRMLTLPTHAFVNQHDCNKIARVLSS